VVLKAPLVSADSPFGNLCPGNLNVQNRNILTWVQFCLTEPLGCCGCHKYIQH
jgi:hypothetical protein